MPYGVTRLSAMKPYWPVWTFAPQMGYFYGPKL